MSIGEKKICDILNKEKIKFETEKTFYDLKHGVYRFDFYIPKSHILIEFDGAQHFQQVKKFHRLKSDFTKGQGHDRQKNSYCLANHIPLYRIPYWDLDKLTNFQSLIKQQYLVKSRWHNDDIWSNHLKGGERNAN